MVGTAVYQPGRASSNQVKNFRALKPGVQMTLAPAARLDRVAAISQWIWNSGMMLRQTSSSRSPKVLPIGEAEAVTLVWVRGTILGREVVPEVCSTRAMSPLWAGPPAAGAP